MLYRYFPIVLIYVSFLLVKINIRISLVSIFSINREIYFLSYYQMWPSLPTPAFFVHFKHTFVTHPAKISCFSITVTPSPRDTACHPPQKNSERALVSGIVNETSVQLTSSLNPNCMNVNIPFFCIVFKSVEEHHFLNFAERV